MYSTLSKGLSNIGCQADFLYKHFIIFAALMEIFSILELINYFPCQGILSKKITQQKVLVVPKLAIWYVPPKTLYIFDVAPKLVPCTELVIIGR